MAAAKKSGADGGGTEKPAKESAAKRRQDPKGGLTAEGRKYFNEKEGLHLRPGVKGAADTPEKMLRKGSFLRRHFAHPPGPVVDAEGQPTRQALQAAAWGEPVPKDEADEKKLAEKGSDLLEQYHRAKADAPKKSSKKAAKAAPKKAATAANKTAAKAMGSRARAKD